MRPIPHQPTWRRSRYRWLSALVAALALVIVFAGTQRQLVRAAIAGSVKS